MSKRIYPNFVNCDWSQNIEDGTPESEMSTMGCRTFTMFDVNGMGYKKVGRGNCIPVTMNLPLLSIPFGISLGERSEPDINGFWKALDDLLSLAKKSLLSRFAHICSQSTNSAPFMYNNGICTDYENALKNGIYETMKHFSLNFGYIGIAEMCQSLFGKNHSQDIKVHKFALCVIKHIDDYVQDAKKEYHLNFATYATPAENSCKTLCEAIKSKYGEIDLITSNGFLTNSHHIPVWEKVSVEDKIKLESPFCKYATAGCITYVELGSSVMHNLDALEDIIDFAMENDIPYFAVNFPIDTCLSCGYSGEIETKCPACGNDAIERLRRVTGYLTTDYKNFNQGKINEVLMRRQHSVVEN